MRNVDQTEGENARFEYIPVFILNRIRKLPDKGVKISWSSESELGSRRHGSILPLCTVCVPIRALTGCRLVMPLLIMGLARKAVLLVNWEKAHLVTHYEVRGSFAHRILCSC